MGENTGSALQYGHVGQAIYLPEEEDWTFTRSFDRRKYLSLFSLNQLTCCQPRPFSIPE